MATKPLSVMTYVPTFPPTPAVRDGETTGCVGADESSPLTPPMLRAVIRRQVRQRTAEAPVARSTP